MIQMTIENEDSLVPFVKFTQKYIIQSLVTYHIKIFENTDIHTMTYNKGIVKTIKDLKDHIGFLMISIKK